MVPRGPSLSKTNLALARCRFLPFAFFQKLYESPRVLGAQSKERKRKREREWLNMHEWVFAVNGRQPREGEDEGLFRRFTGEWDKRGFSGFRNELEWSENAFRTSPLWSFWSLPSSPWHSHSTVHPGKTPPDQMTVNTTPDGLKESLSWSLSSSSFSSPPSTTTPRNDNSVDFKPRSRRSIGSLCSVEDSPCRSSSMSSWLETLLRSSTETWFRLMECWFNRTIWKWTSRRWRESRIRSGRIRSTIRSFCQEHTLWKDLERWAFISLILITSSFPDARHRCRSQLSNWNHHDSARSRQDRRRRGTKNCKTRGYASVRSVSLLLRSPSSLSLFSVSLRLSLSASPPNTISRTTIPSGFSEVLFQPPPPSFLILEQCSTDTQW